jgi:hypothetical protein
MTWEQTIASMAEGRASRSTALQPMLFLDLICFASVGGAVTAGAKPWAVVSLLCIAGLCAVATIAVYCYYAVKRPDLLRSEKFAIRKMELEHSATGDSLRGVVGQLPNQELKILTAGESS